MKEFHCGSLVPGCEWHTRAEEEAEVMRRAAIYGMPYAEWKTRHQQEATPEQLRRMEESVARNAAI